MGPGRRHRVIGMALLAAAGLLAAVGQHDGVVGMTPPEAFPAPGQAPADVVTRVVVDGPLASNDPALAILSVPDGAVLVRAHLEQRDPNQFLVVVLPGAAPPPGTVLVIAGSVQTLLVGSAGDGAAIVRLDARDVREPVLF